jgi:hydroxylamine reductase (hybrid-cluster protein)
VKYERFESARYHNQQAVKKGLKAIVIEKGSRPERTCDVVEFHNAVTGMGTDSVLSVDDAVCLDSIYKGRYSTEGGFFHMASCQGQIQNGPTEGPW